MPRQVAEYWPMSQAERPQVQFGVKRLPALLGAIEAHQEAGKDHLAGAIMEECLSIVKRAGELGIPVDPEIVKVVRAFRDE